MKLNGHYSRSFSIQHSHPQKNVCKVKSKQDIKTSRLNHAIHKQQALEKSRWESKKASISSRNAARQNNDLPLQVAILVFNLARHAVP